MINQQNRVNPQKGNEVTISVSDPVAKKQYGGAKQYYIYHIRGEDKKGPIDIQRRYSDFDSIRNLLIKRWPGCYIPSLPSKVKLSQSDEEFLQTRSKYLQSFLMEISKKTFLWQSDEIQIFLRNNIADFDKLITPLWKVQMAELVYRYQLHFSNLKGESSQKMDENIAQFNKYMSTLILKVQQLRNHSEQINNAQAKYQKKYSKFLLNVLSTYQQKFLVYYNQNNNSFSPIFTAADKVDMKADLEQSMKEVPMKILFEELKREKREIFAIQDATKGYDQYCKQKARIQGRIKQHQIKVDEVKNGKKSFLSKIRSISTEDDVKNHEKSIQKYKSELQICQKICEYIRRLLTVEQLQYFKKERTASYYSMVKKVAQQELKIIEKQRQFWQSVCNSNNFHFEIQEPEIKPKAVKSVEQSKYEQKLLPVSKLIVQKKVVQSSSIKSDKEQKPVPSQKKQEIKNMSDRLSLKIPESQEKDEKNSKPNQKSQQKQQIKESEQEVASINSKQAQTEGTKENIDQKHDAKQTQKDVFQQISDEQPQEPE